MGTSNWTILQLSDGAAPKMQAAITIGLLALLLFFFTRAVMVFIAPDSAYKTPVAADTPVMTQRNSAPAAFDFSFDPFHRAPRALTEPAQGLGEDAPETTLNLTLVGRRAGEGGSAILLTPDRQQAVYRVGDEVINGVILKAVNADFIVLSQSGRLERLTFNKDRKTVLSAQAVMPSAANLSPVMLLQFVRLTRIDRDNQLMGYRLQAKSRGIDLAQYGLQEDDILTQIGDTDLTRGRPELSIVARDIAQKTSIQIRLIRGETPMTVTVGTP